MAVDPNAPVTVGAYSWVPEFARGFVRDLRVRWTLEEIGRDYAVELVDVRMKPDNMRDHQPFAQVPWYRDGEAELFESGAICLWIAQRSGSLTGTGEAEQARTLSWLFSALNSIEPFTMQLAAIDLFSKGEEWAKLRRPKAVADVDKRLAPVEAHLAGREWLGAQFTVADIILATVLRDIHDPAVLERHPALKAYLARAIARPAFQAAMDAQLADFLPLDAAPPTSEGDNS